MSFFLYSPSSYVVIVITIVVIVIMMMTQAGIQLTVLGISLAVSIIGGLITGIIINIPFITR